MPKKKKILHGMNYFKILFMFAPSIVLSIWVKKKKKKRGNIRADFDMVKVVTLSGLSWKGPIA